MTGAVTGVRAAHHVVQFYDAEDDLSSGVASYLAAGLRGEGTAVVLATPEHRAAFVRALASRDIDVGAARRSGALVEADAAQVLGSLRAGEALDVGRFERVVGAMVGSALRRGGPVCAYGELVALLWTAGQVDLAIQLETWWNDLGAGRDFSLYCGYPSGVTSDGDDPLRRVAHQHSAVHGPAVPPAVRGGGQPAPVVRYFDPDRRAPSRARELIRAVLRGDSTPDLVEDAATVVSELATNAVLHTGRGFAVEVACTPDTVRITVSDASPGRAVPRTPTTLDATGRGLILVDALSTRWGRHPCPPGKAVWVELTRAGGDGRRFARHA